MDLGQDLITGQAGIPDVHKKHNLCFIWGGGSGCLFFLHWAFLVWSVRFNEKSLNTKKSELHLIKDFSVLFSQNLLSNHESIFSDAFGFYEAGTERPKC